jgi:pyruvate dehydrogenase E2 component (dihydrolipoamide acetyltransferase)
MIKEIRMPAFSATMETAKLANWLIEEGAAINKGDVVAEVETDKALAEIESPISGIISRILVPAGDNDIAVDVPLVEIYTDASGIEDPAKLSPGSSDLTGSSGSEEPPLPVSSDRRVAASPSARREARHAGVSLHDIAASGVQGRISRQNVLDYVGKTVPANETEMIEASPLRVAIAKAMVRSKSTVPHFYTETDVEIDRLIRLKTEITRTNPDTRISLTALLIMCIAKALQDVPQASLRWETDNNSIVRKDSCDIGFAVDVNPGVIAPVIRNVDSMNVKEVATQLKTLAEQARAGQIKQSDLGDASLTVSNLGMFSIDRFYPIINTPEPMIIGIGRARRSALVINEKIEICSVLTITLAVDHRVIDGAIAGKFAGSLKQHIETTVLK